MLFRPLKSIKFLPTPSARRATRQCIRSTRGRIDFYPRPPRGGRRAELSRDAKITPISTHALREEGDDGYTTIYRDKNKFLPTPSARRATPPGLGFVYPKIFLPTPSARRATLGILTHTSFLGFLPTPSARRATYLRGTCQYQSLPFLPTPSARRATKN